MVKPPSPDMPRPPYSGKTLVAELALMRMKRTQPDAKAVYIAPLKVRVAASERKALGVAPQRERGGV